MPVGRCEPQWFLSIIRSKDAGRRRSEVESAGAGNCLGAPTALWVPASRGGGAKARDSRKSQADCADYASRQSAEYAAPGMEANLTGRLGLLLEKFQQRSREPSSASAFSVGVRNSRVRGHCEQPFGRTPKRRAHTSPNLDRLAWRCHDDVTQMKG